MTQKQTVSFKGALLSCLALCLILCFCAYKLRSYPNGEYDEGVYFATFRLVQSGLPLYQPTFFSQPPGFFTTIFPLYSLLGSTVEAARLGIFFYSIVGLLAILWLGWEFGGVTFSFIAIGVLYLIPIYTVEIMTLQNDSIPATFSTLALASLLHFRRSRQKRWIGLSACFAALAILVKVDVSVLPTLFFIFAAACWVEGRNIKRLIQALALFALVLVLVLLAFVLPFPLDAMVSNIVPLRLQAAAVSPFNPALLWQFMQDQPALIVLLILGIVLSIVVALREKSARFPLFVLASWVAATFILLLIYRPLKTHHLVLLAVPLSLLFAFALAQLLNYIPVRRFVSAAIALFLVVVLWGRLTYALLPQAGVLTPVQQTGLTLVQTYTQPGDYIISDDGIVTGLSNRLIPPGLVDISNTRIWSGNLTVQAFEDNLTLYKPKLILVWAGRLITLQNFGGIMQNYHYRQIERIDSQHKAYLLETG